MLEEGDGDMCICLPELLLHILDLLGACAVVSQFRLNKNTGVWANHKSRCVW